MSGQLGDLVVSISADIARFREDMGRSQRIAQETANKMQREMKSAADSIQNFHSMVVRSAAGAAAALAGGAMFKDMINTSKEVTGEIVKLSRSLGISAEQASVLRVALDDAFLTADDMTAAASRITKQLVGNEDAFKRLGVQTRDQNGNYRSTTEIMAAVNSKLSEFKEGTDRNTEGVRIYGKGWEEARKTLKLTAEAMAEGKKRAEELHLIMGDGAIKAMKDYKLAMKDIDDVAESLKVQIGTALIPELTKMAVAMGETSVKGIPSFITGMHSVQAELMRMAMLADKAGGTVTALSHYATGGKFTETGRWFKEQNEMFKKRYEETEKEIQALANLESGLDKNGNRIVSKFEKSIPGKTSRGSITANPEWKMDNDLLLANIKLYQDMMKEQEKVFYELGQEMDQAAAAAKNVFNIMNSPTGEFSTKRYNVTPLSKYRLMTNQQYTIPDQSSGKEQGKEPEVSPFGTTQFDAIVDRHKAMYDNIKKLEEDWGKNSLAAQNAISAAKIESVRDSVAAISGFMMSGNREMFAAGKALAISMAAVDGAMAVNKALASAPPPMNYVSAALVGAATAMQMMKIASAQYQARAMGGPVNRGQTYLVGERGPELFTPGASGGITPNHALGGNIQIVQKFEITGVGADIAQNTKIVAKQAADRAKLEILNSMNRGGEFALASGRMR